MHIPRYRFEGSRRAGFPLVDAPPNPLAGRTGPSRCGGASVAGIHARLPCDLAADGDTIAQIFADARVAFVDTGHTHYSEILNDGRVIYAATRSTGQIEEGSGIPGYAVITIHNRVASWRFKEIGSAWPFVQIVAPGDLRMVTRPADPLQIPRPGNVEIIAKIFGEVTAPGHAVG